MQTPQRNTTESQAHICKVIQHIHTPLMRYIDKQQQQ